MSIPAPLAYLIADPCWTAWRNEIGDDGRPTKIPYCAVGHKAESDNPATWLPHDQAVTVRDAIVNGSDGGIGIWLGQHGYLWIAGIDLDTCRDPVSTLIAPWAVQVIQRFASYTEVSPSGGGVKISFLVDPADAPELRTIMGTQHGRQFKQANGASHPPAIELYVSHRYFTITWEGLPDAPTYLRTVPLDDLRWLIERTGPAFAGKAERKSDADSRDDTSTSILGRLNTAAKHSKPIATALRNAATMHGGSRSEGALGLGGTLKRAGWTFLDMKAALLACPATCEWAHQVLAEGDRQFNRIWEKAEAGSSEAANDDEQTDVSGKPDVSILRLNRRPPPALPIGVFGAEWGNWISNAAEAACCPVDYVAAPLLSSASALIGNARWAQGWHGWEEPPVLWLASVGDSGDGKSPGGDTLFGKVLPELERRMVGDFPDKLRDWQTTAEIAKLRTQEWQAELVKARKTEQVPPTMPDDIDPGPEPQSPRLRQMDSTIEKVAILLASAAPKGLLMVRDELAGFLLGMTTYNDSARAFWLESYGGRPYRVERVKLSEPINVPHNTCAWYGTIQPERLAQVMAEPDDGLLARFCWAWPNPVPFEIAHNAPNVDFAITGLDRLRRLELFTRADGTAHPVLVPLTEAARQLMVEFGRQMQAQKDLCEGLLRSACGKARGLALRIALVLEMLWWSGKDSFDPPPTVISAAALDAACRLVSDYLLPMGERTYGDAASAQQERAAAMLARWVMQADPRPTEIHVRKMQREVRLAGMKTAEEIHAACAVLVDACWLLAAPKPHGMARAKASYPVNPALWDALP